MSSPLRAGSLLALSLWVCPAGAMDLDLDLTGFEACPGLAPALAQPPGSGERDLFLSTYTHHWTHSDEHKPVRAISVRQNLRDNRFCGFSMFTNSFGQPSGYVFIGKSWPELIEGVPSLYATVSAGVLYGYVSRYRNKVPLNVKGFSPAIIPAVGWRLSSQLSVEAHVLGTAAVMIGADWRY